MCFRSDPWFSVGSARLGFNFFSSPSFGPIDGYPALSAYRARLEARPAYAAARARDGVQDFYDRDFYPVPEVAP